MITVHNKIYLKVAAQTDKTTGCICTCRIIWAAWTAVGHFEITHFSGNSQIKVTVVPLKLRFSHKPFYIPDDVCTPVGVFCYIKYI